MLRPVSKPADMYNYRVAAYLKTCSKNLKIFDYAIEKLSFNVLPPPILKTSSFLNVEALLDLVISGSDREFLCECKHHQMPKPFTLNSIDVKDALLEFIASEKYRINSFKRDTISYLLITNCSTLGLSKELDELKVAEDKEVTEYSLKLKARALRKWEGSYNPAIDINLEWVRNALIRTNPIEIDEGRLQEASKNIAFKQELERILEQVAKKNPELIPIENRVKNTIRLEIPNDIQKPVIKSKRGFSVEISKQIIEQISSKQTLTISKADSMDLPFIANCELRHHPNVSTEKAMELVVETINDIIRRDPQKQMVVTINPGTYEVYFANTDWFRKELTTNPKGFFEISNIAKRLPFAVSKFVMVSLIEECMRPAGQVPRQDVMDFTGFNE